MDVETLLRTHEAHAPGAVEADWLRELRVRALERFRELGLPGSHLEAWKYTSTKVLAAAPFVHAPARPLDDVEGLIATERLPHAWAELVFVDGRLCVEASRLPDDATVDSLATAIAARPDEVRPRLGRLAPWADEAFTALNVAFLQDGLWLRVGRGRELPGPVHVLSVTRGGTVAHLRHVVELEPGAAATVVETCVGPEGEAALANTVAEAVVGTNARLDWLVTGAHPETAHQVHDLEVRLARDARVHAHLTWLGGALTRSNVRIVHAEPGAEALLDGLYVVGGRQHVDNHTVVDHVADHGTTREVYKGVVGGRAKGVFDGLVIVRPGAQKTDSEQSCRNLLLSEDADANAKPTLEIYADDVKCSHGTTVGQLDREQLAYLRSRGIPAEEARRMLTLAFVADRVERVRDPALRERLAARVDARLAALQEEG